MCITIHQSRNKRQLAHVFNASMYIISIIHQCINVDTTCCYFSGCPLSVKGYYFYRNFPQKQQFSYFYIVTRLSEIKRQEPTNSQKNLKYEDHGIAVGPSMFNVNVLFVIFNRTLRNSIISYAKKYWYLKKMQIQEKNIFKPQHAKTEHSFKSG